MSSAQSVIPAASALAALETTTSLESSALMAEAGAEEESSPNGCVKVELKQTMDANQQGNGAAQHEDDVKRNSAVAHNKKFAAVLAARASQGQRAVPDVEQGLASTHSSDDVQRTKTRCQQLIDGLKVKAMGCKLIVGGR